MNKRNENKLLKVAVHPFRYQKQVRSLRDMLKSEALLNFKRWQW